VSPTSLLLLLLHPNSSLPKVEFDRLLHMGTWTTLRKGAVLQEAGKPSNSVFLIVSGGVDVSSKGELMHNLDAGQVMLIHCRSNLYNLNMTSIYILHLSIVSIVSV